MRNTSACANMKQRLDKLRTEKLLLLVCVYVGMFPPRTIVQSAKEPLALRLQNLYNDNKKGH